MKATSYNATRFKDKIALITGSARGNGEGAARVLARRCDMYSNYGVVNHEVSVCC